MDYKIAHVIHTYLHDDPSTVLAPSYRANGYESVILHSDSNQTNITQTPLTWDIADTIRQRRVRQSQ
ncbi:MAG: hypothetical protein H6766_06995 [Candidatus Peribacteria bacterium]|nr:MAG: hypothetical protein H6766_06995 [Candidatus Peribacteria bacterium]